MNKSSPMYFEVNNNPLSHDDTMALIEAAQSGNRDASERLINSNIRLVMSVVNRFKTTSYEMDDLFQIGCIGLVKAINRFDTKREVQFSTYAVPLIIGEIRRYMRDDGPIKVSRNLKSLAGQASKMKEVLSARLGREATIPEIAKELDVSNDRIVEAFEASLTPSSIYQPVQASDNDDLYLIDSISDRDALNEESSIVDKITLNQALDKLDEREKNVIRLRFLEDINQSNVAKALDISQPQVSRIEKRALLKIRELLESNP